MDGDILLMTFDNVVDLIEKCCKLCRELKLKHQELFRRNPYKELDELVKEF